MLRLLFKRIKAIPRFLTSREVNWKKKLIMIISLILMIPIVPFAEVTAITLFIYLLFKFGNELDYCVVRQQGVDLSKKYKKNTIEDVEFTIKEE